MNGRSHPAMVFAAVRCGKLRAAMNPDAYLSNRLYAALMVSCLLHAALVFMPYLGASTTVSRPAVRASRGRPASST